MVQTQFHSPQHSNTEISATPADTIAAELVTTRICHDLAGLASAFSNGAEIINQHLDDKNMLQSSAELLTMSADDARARICLFRKLFGSDQQDQETPDVIIGMMRDYLRGFTVESTGGTEMLEAAQAKILLAFAMITQKAFPGKATITVTFNGNGYVCVSEGRMLAIDEHEHATLAAKNAPSVPCYDNLASWRLRRLATQGDVSAIAEFGDKRITLTVEPSPA